MAHQITATDKVYLHKTAAWHGLGDVFAEPLGSEELRKHCFPWEPAQRYLWLKDSADGPPVGKVPDRKAIVRGDTGAYLGTVGMGYTPFGNGQLVEAVEKALPGVTYETGGTLYGGARVWALAHLNTYVVGDKKKEDEQKQYLLIANGHDGSFRVYFGRTDVRVVCNNTLTAAVFDYDYTAGEHQKTVKDGMLAFRHTRNVAEKVLDAGKAIAAAQANAKKFQETANALAATPVNEEQAKAFFKAVFPPPVGKKKKPAPAANGQANGDGAALLDEIVAQQTQGKEVVADLLAGYEEATERAKTMHANLLATLIETYHQKDNAGGFGENAWTALNTVTKYVDHGRTVRAADGVDAADARMDSIVWGGGNQIKQTALVQAVKLLGA